MKSLSDDERVTLAGEYVLGVLSPAERLAVEQRMSRDPELARRVREWQADLATLEDGADITPTAPAPDLLDRIEAALFPPPDPPAT